MPLLTREDWETLRNRYHVAFWGMDPALFQLLLDKVYGPKSNPGSDPPHASGVDDADAMMIYLVRGGAEPPIGP